MNLWEILSQTKENFIDSILIHNENETLLRYLFDSGWISKHYDDEMLLIAGLNPQGLSIIRYLIEVQNFDINKRDIKGDDILLLVC